MQLAVMAATVTQLTAATYLQAPEQKWPGHIDENEFVGAPAAVAVQLHCCCFELTAG